MRQSRKKYQRAGHYQRDRSHHLLGWPHQSSLFGLIIFYETGNGLPKEEEEEEEVVRIREGTKRKHIRWRNYRFIYLFTLSSCWLANPLGVLTTSLFFVKESSSLYEENYVECLSVVKSLFMSTARYGHYGEYTLVDTLRHHCVELILCQLFY